MDDFFDDYDDFDGDDYDGDSFDEDYEDDECDCEADTEDFENDDPDNCQEDTDKGFFDEFTGKDAFYAGTLMGFAYQEGVVSGQYKRFNKKQTDTDADEQIKELKNSLSQLKKKWLCVKNLACSHFLARLY